MAFDVSAPIFNGPPVNVSLFGEAARTGALLGREIPSFGTAAVQGIETGVREGLQDAALFQENEVRQNQIEQEPIQNAKQAEQLRQMQQINSIRDTQVQEDLATRDTQIELARQTADIKLQQAKQQEEDINNVGQINDMLAKGTEPAFGQIGENADGSPILGPTGGTGSSIGQIFSNPRFLRTLESNPQLADRVARAAMDDKGTSPEDKAKAFAFADLAKQSQYRTATARLVNAERRSTADTNYAKNLSGAAGIIAAATGTANLADLTGDENSLLQYHVAPNGYFPLKTDAQGRQSIDSSKPPNTKSREEVSGLKLMEPYQVFKGDQLVGNTTESNAVKFGQHMSGIVERRSLYGLNTGSSIPAPSQEPSTPEAPGHVATFGNPAPVTAPPTPTVTPPPAPPGSDPQVWRQMYNQQLQERAQSFKAKAENVPINPSASIVDNLHARQKAINSGTTLPSQVAPQGTVSPTSYDLNTTLSTPGGAKFTLASDTAPVLGKNIGRVVDRINSNPYLSGAPIVIKGMAAVESGGNPNAVSPTGVSGLLQVTKSTARMYGLNRDIPSENVAAGTLYMTDLMSRYNGNLRYALTAYNVGPGAMSDAIREADSSDWGDVLVALKDRVSPKKYAEASVYADKVMAHTALFMNQNPTQRGSFLWSAEQSGAIRPAMQTS